MWKQTKTRLTEDADDHESGQQSQDQQAQTERNVAAEAALRAPGV